nr:DUF3658 domain-containing protein [Nocardia brasiliensis]
MRDGWWSRRCGEPCSPEAAGADWTPISRIIAPVMAVMSVADAPLIWRVQTLVESGAMVADGSPWLVRRTKVKRA